MSLQSLPSEIILQIIQCSLDDFASAPSNRPLLVPLRSTCKRFSALLAAHAPYLSSSLLPPLPKPQTYRNLSTYLPTQSKPQTQCSPAPVELDNLITHLSRSFLAQSLISRIRHAVESEKQRQIGISANLAEYLNAIKSIPTSLCALRDISTFTDILSLPSCPPSAGDAMASLQGWKTSLLQQHLRSVQSLDAFDTMIAVLFALSTLLNERRKSWLVTVQTYAATTGGTSGMYSIEEGQQSIMGLADELLDSEVSSEEDQCPTYAYTSLHKFRAAEIILRKGLRWVHDLISRLEESEAEMLCVEQTSSPKIGSSAINETITTAEDRVRELLVPMDEIETRRLLNQTIDTSFSRVENSGGLPLLKLIWKERERKTAWKIREERECEGKERLGNPKDETEQRRGPSECSRGSGHQTINADSTSIMPDSMGTGVTVV